MQVVFKMKMSFKTQRVLEKIQDEEFIGIAEIQQAFENDIYLPKNRSDAYASLRLLVKQKYLTKIKQGLYKVNSDFIKQELGALQ